MSRPTNAQAGLSLIEVLIAVSILGISFIALGSSVLTGAKSTMAMEGRSVVRNQGLRYMERLQKLSFGDILDAAPDSAVLDRLLSDEADIPDVSLFQIATPVDDFGHRFRIAGFEQKGTWEIRVNRDINGNGVIDGDEVHNDILRVEILFRDEPILTTFRNRPPQAT